MAADFQVDVLDKVAQVIGGSQPDPFNRPRWFSGKDTGDGTGLIVPRVTPPYPDFKGCYSAAPDMIAEVVSPNEGYEEVQSRIADFRSAKMPLIWVISPVAKSVLIRRLDGSCDEIYEGGILSGEDVIPGFTCKVAELFV